jgi:translocator protein
MQRRELVALAIFSLGTLLLGLTAGLTAMQTSAQYAQLQGPSWAPPPWLFGPVWTVLYLLIGTSAWLVWRLEPKGPALRLWGAQLALNLAWTPLFFGLGLRFIALVDIVLLWLLIVATIVFFARRSKTAAWLLAPYLAWVSFATVLNAAYWWLNR